MSEWNDFMMMLAARANIARENGEELHLTVAEADKIKERAGFDPFLLFGVPVVLDV